jgi:predicted RNA-binding protein Jag
MEATGNSVAAESSNLHLDPPAGEAEAADNGSGGAAAAAPDAEQAEIGAADDQAAAGWESDSEREPLDAAVVARDLLDQILQAMDVPAEVGAQRQPDGSVRLLVEGHEMGVVIGKHGSTINALQYLVGLILQKRTGERTRLVIDAEGYRNRREQALKEMALTYAQRVRESGHEAVLDALQSYERRIIHNSLADDPDVFTYSEGEEPDRRVVISPREAGEAGEE